MTTSDRSNCAGLRRFTRPARRPLTLDIVSPEPDPADQAAVREMLAALDRIIQQHLPETLRQTALSHWVDGKSRHQIAAELGLHPTTVRDRLLNASRVLLDRFGPALREIAPDLEAEARRNLARQEISQSNRMARISNRRRASRIVERNRLIPSPTELSIPPILAAAPVMEVSNRVWRTIRSAIDQRPPRRRGGLELLWARAVRVAESLRDLTASLAELPDADDLRGAVDERLRQRRSQLALILRVIDASTIIPLVPPVPWPAATRPSISPSLDLVQAVG